MRMRARMSAGVAMGAALVVALSTGALAAAPSGYAATDIVGGNTVSEPLSDASAVLSAVDRSTGDPLAGAGFLVENGRGLRLAVGPTGADGKVTFSVSGWIPGNDYVVTELVAPPGYDLDPNTRIGWGIRQDVGLDRLINGPTVSFVKSTTGATSDAALDIRALELGDGAGALSGASFVLDGGNGPRIVGPTGADGTARVGSLAPGTYSIKPYSAPAGYGIANVTTNATIQAGQTLPVAINAFVKAAPATFADTHPGTYQLRNVKSGQLLDVKDGSTQAGAAIIQWPSNGGDNQQWTFEAHNGHTRLVSKRSSDIVAVKDGATNTGQPLIQWAPTGTPDQEWDLQPTADGHYSVVNGKSGLVLAVQDGSTAAGAIALQTRPTGALDQEWDLIRVQ